MNDMCYAWDEDSQSNLKGRCEEAMRDPINNFKMKFDECRNNCTRWGTCNQKREDMSWMDRFNRSLHVEKAKTCLEEAIQSNASAWNPDCARCDGPWNDHKAWDFTNGKVCLTD